MVSNAEDFGVGNRAEQVANQAVEFRVGDEMRRLPVAKRSPEHAGEAEQRAIAAGEAIGPAIATDEFALDAKGGRLKGKEIDVFESAAIDRFAKHDCRFLSYI